MSRPQLRQESEDENEQWEQRDKQLDRHDDHDQADRHFASSLAFSGAQGRGIEGGAALGTRVSVEALFGVVASGAVSRIDACLEDSVGRGVAALGDWAN
ncbi:hypothetical protein [Algisphaera agarilytica]|uniref:Uncharacterized protein n=1 Tax=Algisphaera agarilytica TaxID=1385975 RepID=A0A7X0LLI9_9BACT|nr:hypothetical protein [Algisphaera agarilytica]MBB6431057.1 hypothetical protein [Algisphaera agarilytica]